MADVSYWSAMGAASGHIFFLVRLGRLEIH